MPQPSQNAAAHPGWGPACAQRHEPPVLRVLALRGSRARRAAASSLAAGGRALRYCFLTLLRSARPAPATQRPRSFGAGAALGSLLGLALWVAPAGAGADFAAGQAAYNAGDYRGALQVWKPLAEQGDVQAQYHLGLMYDTERGVLRNDHEAVKWYRRAAEQGHVVAQRILGQMYQDGEGVAQSYPDAVQWYRLAAEQGDASAANSLGWMYRNGHGVPWSNVHAHMWFEIAAERGHTGAAKSRESLKRRMTPAQLEQAWRLARDWLAQHPYAAWVA